MSAYKEVSILSGHRIERQERGARGEFAFIEAMNRQELIEFIRKGLEDGIIVLQLPARPTSAAEADAQKRVT